MQKEGPPIILTVIVNEKNMQQTKIFKKKVLQGIHTWEWNISFIHTPMHHDNNIKSAIITESVSHRTLSRIANNWLKQPLWKGQLTSVK